MTRPQDKQKRSLLWLLAGSLLLNMFLMGFMVARWSLSPQHAARLGPPQAERGRQADRRERASVMHKLMAERRPELRARRQAIHAARRDVRDALVAEPFDQAELTTALATLRAATSNAQAALHASLVEAAPGMSVAERQRLSRAHRLWSGRGGRGGKRGGPGPRRPPGPPGRDGMEPDAP